MNAKEVIKKPTQELIAKSKNGVGVTYDPVGSHAATHFDDTPNLKELVAEVIGNLDLDGQEFASYVDMERIVGTCDVVKVDKADEIVYGQRKNRAEDGLVPFTKSRPAEPCQNVALHLLPQEDGTYMLSSAWIGTFDDDEPFPGSINANERSIDYWSRYAFVYGSQEIVSGTETNIRPW